jgi:hypothetical protein
LGHDSPPTQLEEEVLSPIKRIHLHIDGADLPEGMGIRTRPRCDPKRAAQLLCSPVDLGLRPAVEDLDDVNVSSDPLDRFFPEVAPTGIVRVFKVDEASLFFDGGDRLFWPQTLTDGIRKEQPDQLTVCRQDLLADDGRLPGLEERLGPADSVMVGEEDGGEAQLTTSAGHLSRRDSAIKGGRAVQVEIHPNPGAPCASGHVRYYRPGEGPAKVRTPRGGCWLVKNP